MRGVGLPLAQEDWPADALMEFEERAAIMEIDGGLKPGNVAQGGPGGATCLSLSCYTFPGGQGRGGGVFASGPVTITRSTVSGNTARGGAGRAGDGLGRSSTPAWRSSASTAARSRRR